MKPSNPMKLVIQIPCYNEEQSLGRTLDELPRSIPGVTSIETVLVDDGSTDRSVAIAGGHGVDEIVALPGHLGLASAFRAGLEASVQRGADIIVNTDADNQYRGADIARLVEPIIEGRADMVVGERPIEEMSFSKTKKLLQRLGSAVVRRVSGTRVPDATSGFRAFTRDVAMRLLVLSEYSYTLETLIQAGSRHIAVEYVPIRTNPPTRPSRLMRGYAHFVSNSAVTIMRAYTLYRPLRIFLALGFAMVGIGILLGLRFLYFYIAGSGGGHVQSLILAAVLLIIGFQTILIGLVADLVGFNRKIMEETLYRVRKLEAERTSTSELDS